MIIPMLKLICFGFQDYWVHGDLIYRKLETIDGIRGILVGILNEQTRVQAGYRWGTVQL